MIDIIDAIRRTLGAKADAASGTGNLNQQLSELLTNRLSTARAAKIDNLDAAVSTRLTGLVKSIQYVLFSTAAATAGDVTISSVNTSKTWCFWLGGKSSGTGANANTALFAAYVTTSTNVHFVRSVAPGGSSEGRACVVEFF